MDEIHCISVLILSLELKGTTSHHLDDLPLALPIRSTNSPLIISSYFYISLQNLLLHTSKVLFRLLRFKAIDHGLPMTRLKGRSEQVQALRKRPTC